MHILTAVISQPHTYNIYSAVRTKREPGERTTETQAQTPPLPSHGTLSQVSYIHKELVRKANSGILLTYMTPATADVMISLNNQKQNKN